MGLVITANNRRSGSFEDPTILTLSGSTTLSTSARYYVLVSSPSNYTLTISADKSHLIRNEGSVAFTVAPSGVASFSLVPGAEARVSWDVETAVHKVATDLPVDSAMSATSTNPVQNAIAKAYVDSAVAAIPGATVDSAMSGSSSNPVQNQVIKSYVDAQLGGGILVTLTGTGSTDTANVNTAIGLLNTAGKGTLFLSEGTLNLTSSLTAFSAPISVHGIGSGPLVVKTGAGISSFSWVKSGLPSSPSESHYDIAATAGDDYFTTSAYTPARGDVVLLYSGDAVPNLIPHIAGGVTYPASMHRVQRWDSANSRAYVEAALPDTLSTGAKAAVYPALMQGVSVRNLRFRSDTTSSTNSMTFYGLDGLEIENIHIDQDGTGQIFLQHCMNAKISNVVIEGTKAADGVYGISLSLCNGVVISDCVITGTRHSMNFSGWTTVGTARYGGAYNVRVNNCIFNNPQKQDGTTTVPIDTHPETNHIVFDSCTVTSGPGGYYCGQTRSRNTTFKNCVFRGKSAKGLQISGPNCTIDNCTFTDLGLGIQTLNGYDTDLDRTTATYADGLRVLHCSFKNIVGPAVWSTTGHDQWVSHNTFENCGRYAGGSPSYPRAIVIFEHGDGHRVTNNTFVYDGTDGRATIDIGMLDSVADIAIVGNSFVKFVKPNATGTATMAIGRFMKGAIIADPATETFTGYYHGLVNGYYGKLQGTTIPTGLSSSTTYYVVNATSHTFQLSTTLGGSAEAFSTAGSGLYFMCEKSGVEGRFGYGVELTADNSTDTFTYAGGGSQLATNDWGYLRGSALPTGLVGGDTVYYVINAGEDSFQLSTSAGGAAATFTSNGAALCFDATCLALDTTFANNWKAIR